ncbi:WD40 repeat-like protein [Tuber magnatum]|uniref:WD40 repeat-like protein n=1 Tax=Tuber magnatum TaxID=42249 RepID=A0A317SVZ5_9PEZI|nr:WD40 repeat-like protein [Tuber magnatum]
MGASKSPTATPTTTQTNYSRKHGRDDGINGVSNAGATGGGSGGGASHKRRKKAVSGPDGDTPMTDGFPETPVTVAEEPRVTNGCSVGVQVEDIVEITAEDSVILGQEDKSILICAWNPIHSNVLATASQDSIARIWNVPMNATSSTAIQNKVILHDPSSSPKRDVTAIRWSPQGDLIATGSYDGQTRIWTTDGLLRHTLPPHHGPVIALKWNRSADTLLSLSCDGKVIAWDALTGDMRRSFEQAKEDQGKGGQAEAATDMDWISERQFAICGSGGSVGIYDLDHDSSLNADTSHSGEVNCLVWDECSERLASGGEDGDVLIWEKPSKILQSFKLQGHTEAVVSLCWQPIASSPQPTKRILASASNDCQVRLWDVHSKTCINILNSHDDPVEKISFSPSGARLASSANSKVIIWNAETGVITHVYDGLKGRRKNGRVIAAGAETDADIGEISWDESGARVAIGGGETKVHVLMPASPPAILSLLQQQPPK